MKMDAGYDKMNIIFRIFCVYDEPSADLCLHKDLHLSNVHHLAVKRDGVQSIQIEQESACSIIHREETAGMSHIIFHIDVNSAYLSWTAVEQLKNGADVTSVRSPRSSAVTENHATGSYWRNLLRQRNSAFGRESRW